MSDGNQTCPRCGRTEPADADFCYCGFVFAKAGQRGSTLPPRAIPASGTDVEPNGRNLARDCGNASLVAPVIALLLSCMTRFRIEEGGATAMILIVVTWGLPLIGLITAVIALVGVARHGPKGLLVPGLLGLFINGGIVLAILFTLFKR